MSKLRLCCLQNTFPYRVVRQVSCLERFDTVSCCKVVYTEYNQVTLKLMKNLHICWTRAQSKQLLYLGQIIPSWSRHQTQVNMMII